MASKSSGLNLSVVGKSLFLGFFAVRILCLSVLSPKEAPEISKSGASMLETVPPGSNARATNSFIADWFPSVAAYLQPFSHALGDFSL
jgi:hypothetical protein